MKSHREEITFNTQKRTEFIRITDQVQQIIDQSGIKEGLCLVNSMHISSSVFINDNESGLWKDFETWLEKLAPYQPISQYRHNDTGEDNADAHLKRTVMGREVVVAVTKGKLDFGPWEEIFYGEFDGMRRKRVLVKIIGE
ncbi:MAG: secondary thiamine-phosphate synthase enzyme YjbQ [Candidatus Caenarcaniphilales bacterium]|nr:secondary thiamine-phosphate synthase enzyme YjbQ [Candidatus Caenarcaniphilales bacterium]